MNGLLIKLKNKLELRNYSEKSIKSYVYCVERYLSYSRLNGINENSAKEFLRKQLKTKNPSTVSLSSSAIQFFFNKILKQHKFI